MKFNKLIKRAIKYPEQLTKDEKYDLYVLKVGTESLLKKNPDKEPDDVVKLLMNLFGLTKGGQDGKKD